MQCRFRDKADFVSKGAHTLSAQFGQSPSFTASFTGRTPLDNLHNEFGTTKRKMTSSTHHQERSEQSPGPFAFGQHMLQSQMPDFYISGLEEPLIADELGSFDAAPQTTNNDVTKSVLLQP